MSQVPPVPDLSDAAVVRAIAGIRPCRHGGLRLETERVSRGARTKTVIHNYGHGGCGVTLALGCAQAAADLVAREVGAGAPVAVLGAGVVGLSTAVELSARGHGVTVYASEAGPATTSGIAGAIWLPTGLDFPEPGPERDRLNALLRRSDELLRACDGERWGIETLPVYEPAGAPFESHLFESGAVELPTEIAELPVGASRGPGKTYESLFMHTPRFLRTLDDLLRSQGDPIVERRFAGLDEVLALEEPVAVNCLALGSRELFGDDAMYPARGVLVHLRPQPLGYVVHDGYRYMFPRNDALVLGGTFEPGVDNPTPPDETVREILAHHRRFFGLTADAGSPQPAR